MERDWVKLSEIEVSGGGWRGGGGACTCMHDDTWMYMHWASLYICGGGTIRIKLQHRPTWLVALFFSDFVSANVGHHIEGIRGFTSVRWMSRCLHHPPLAVSRCHPLFLHTTKKQATSLSPTYRNISHTTYVIYVIYVQELYYISYHNTITTAADCGFNASVSIPLTLAVYICICSRKYRRATTKHMTQSSISLLYYYYYYYYGSNICMCVSGHVYRYVFYFFYLYLCLYRLI